MLVHDYLKISVDRDPERIALVCGARRTTYAELARDASGLASALVERGVMPGDRVIVVGDNATPTAIALWAVLEAGAVVVMTNPHIAADRLAAIVDDCRPAAAIADAPVLGVPTIAPAARGSIGHHARAGEDDVAAIIYTSGSTGEPKGVAHTHRSMCAAATAVMAYLDIARDDVILGVLPLAFSYGMYQLIMAVAAGARLVLAPAGASAYASSLMQLVAAERVTVLPGVPALFATLLPAANHADHTSIRTITSAAAPLPVAHLAALCDRFAPARVFSMYGLTECKRVSYLPPDQVGARPASVGVAIPGSELWIVDEHDRRVARGEVGQLVVRSPTIMRGYWNKPVETAARLRPGPRAGERVLYTGDLARFDDGGYLYIVGRIDDIIKSRGEKVAPREVENVLAEAPGVREAAVIGVRDDHLGQAVAAFVVVDDPTVTARVLQQHCRRRLEPHMVPKHVVFAAALPRTANGKVDKRRLAL